MRMLKDPDDYYWYNIDQVSYDAEFERMQKERKQKYDEHMAKFKTPFKLTIQEIKDKLARHEERIKQYNRLNAPAIIIEQEQHNIDKLVTLWTSNDVLKSSADRTYRNAYQAHDKKFNFEFVPNVPPHVQDQIHIRLQQKSDQSLS